MAKWGVVHNEMGSNLLSNDDYNGRLRIPEAEDPKLAQVGGNHYKVGQYVRRKPAHQSNPHWVYGDKAFLVENFDGDFLVATGLPRRKFEYSYFELSDWQGEQPHPGTIDPKLAQVGGNHYKYLAIQPIDYITKNKLGWCEGNIVKYITRWKQKGGVGDIDKVIHYAEILKGMQKCG